MSDGMKREIAAGRPFCGFRTLIGGEPDCNRRTIYDLRTGNPVEVFNAGFNDWTKEDNDRFNSRVEELNRQFSEGPSPAGHDAGTTEKEIPTTESTNAKS